MAGGRPSIYTQELAALICHRVATHRYGIKKLCRMFDDMPDHTTIHAWRYTNREFSNQYLEAKKSQIDLAIEEIDEIIQENILFYKDSEGNDRIDSPSATIAIAKANNAKWAASKLLPQIYGDNKKDDNKDDSVSLLEKLVTGKVKINHD